jgi:hypothetical protein
MQIEPIKLKIGEDDWEMDFCISTPNPWIDISYKKLSYQFGFSGLDHLKRDCKALANYQLNCFKTLPFGQEKIHLSPSGQSLVIVTPSDAMQNIIIPLPVWFQSELSKRFCEPEKPKMPELQVGDLCHGIIKATETETDVEILKIFRDGVKIWEAGV